MELETSHRTLALVRQIHSSLEELVQQVPGADFQRLPRKSTNIDPYFDITVISTGREGDRPKELKPEETRPDIEAQLYNNVHFDPQESDEELIDEVFDHIYLLNVKFNCASPGAAITLFDKMRAWEQLNCVNELGDRELPRIEYTINIGYIGVLKPKWKDEFSKDYDYEFVFTPSSRKRVMFTSFVLAQELEQLGLDLFVEKDIANQNLYIGKLEDYEFKGVAEIYKRDKWIIKNSCPQREKLADLLFNHYLGRSVFKVTETILQNKQPNQTIDRFVYGEPSKDYDLRVFPADGSAFRFFDSE